MHSRVSLGARGKVGIKVMRGTGGAGVACYAPTGVRVGVGWRLRNLRYMVPGLWRVGIMRLFGLSGVIGKLSVRLMRGDGSVVDYGVVSLRVVTTAFVNFLVDQLQTETSEFGDLKYHDSGIGTTAAAVGDTDIETTDGESRATGTQTEGDSTYEYRSVGTISYTSTKAITEHGIFTNSAGGTMADHHVFSAVNVVSGDSIQFTFDLEFPAGS